MARKPARKTKRIRKLIDAGEATRFQVGVSGLLLKKGIKKATEDYIRLSLDFICPDEWLVDGLEVLRGKKMTFGHVMAVRRLYCAVTGTLDRGLKPAQEIWNRVLGREPTIIKHGEAEPDDDFEGRSGEELIAIAMKLSESIQAKRKLLPAPKEEDAAQENPERDDADKA